MTWESVEGEVNAPFKSSYATVESTKQKAIENEKKHDKKQIVDNSGHRATMLDESLFFNPDLGEHIKAVVGLRNDDAPMGYIPLQALNYSMPWKRDQDYKNEELAKFIPESSGEPHGYLKQVRII